MVGGEGRSRQGKVEGSAGNRRQASLLWSLKGLQRDSLTQVAPHTLQILVGLPKLSWPPTLHEDVARYKARGPCPSEHTWREGGEGDHLSLRIQCCHFTTLFHSFSGWRNWSSVK